MGLVVSSTDFDDLRLRAAGTAFHIDGATGHFSKFALPGNGRARFDAVRLPDKLTLNVARCDLEDELDIEQPRGKVIRLGISVSGDLAISSDDRVSWRRNQKQALLRAPNPRANIYVRVAPRVPWSFVRLDFDPDYFFDAACGLGYEPLASLKLGLAIGNGHVLHTFTCRADTRMCVAQIADCVYEGMLRLAYLRAKTLELMALAFRDMFNADTRSLELAAVQPVLRNRVEKVHARLVRDLTQAPTIAELAATAHLSETTLKQAFRVIYGDSIYSYWKNLRLERARQLLHGTNFSVLAVANSIGYTCSSRFSTAFRQRYGVAPSEYAHQVRVERRRHSNHDRRPAIVQ